MANEDKAVPLTTAEVEAWVPVDVVYSAAANDGGCACVLVSRSALLATTLELEAEQRAHRAHEAGEHALTRRAERAEKALDCGQAGPVCSTPAPGCLRHNLEHQRDLVAQRDEARTHMAEWQAEAESTMTQLEEATAKHKATVIERDEYDARLMVAEMAQTALVEALERFVTHWSPYEITLTPGDVKKGWEALEMVKRPSITPCSVDCGACNGDPAKAKEGKP